MTRDPSESDETQPITPGEAQWAAIEREIRNLAHKLKGAPEEAVHQHMSRLHSRADLIEDPLWQRRAHRIIDVLPRKIAGPKPGESAQYWEATALVQRYLSTEYTDAAQRVADGEAVLEQVGALSRAAPFEEEFVILGMNGAVNRKIMWTD